MINLPFIIAQVVNLLILILAIVIIALVVYILAKLATRLRIHRGNEGLRPETMNRPIPPKSPSPPPGINRRRVVLSLKPAVFNCWAE